MSRDMVVEIARQEMSRRVARKQQLGIFFISFAAFLFLCFYFIAAVL